MKSLPEDLYPRVREGYKFRLAPDHVELRAPGPTDGHRLSEPAWAVYEKCRGDRSIREMAEELSAEWEVSTPELLAFLIDAAKRGYIGLAERPDPRDLSVVGSRTSYFPKIRAACPGVASRTTWRTFSSFSGVGHREHSHREPTLARVDVLSH